MYVDGANLNALVGLAKPGRFGADVSHLNLHKTFCIPHGGGGPGSARWRCASTSLPFLPGHPLADARRSRSGRCRRRRSARRGSCHPWAYIALMGPDGLRRATAVAILRQLPGDPARRHYPVLYTAPAAGSATSASSTCARSPRRPA